MYGVRFVPLRVHNVVLVSEGVCWCDFHDELEERTGDVVVKVSFGKERRKVVISLCCDVPGMDRDTLLFALNRAYDLVRARSGGRVLESVRFVTLETNRDFSGVRLEGGFKVYTLPNLNNIVERIYQKEDNLVRHELKVSEKMTVDQFLELAHGGVSTYNVAQATFHLTQKVEGLTDVVKILVGFVGRSQKVQDAILDRLYRLNDRLDGNVHSKREKLG
jgi:hypothetical protein